MGHQGTDAQHCFLMSIFDTFWSTVHFGPRLPKTDGLESPLDAITWFPDSVEKIPRLELVFQLSKGKLVHFQSHDVEPEAASVETSIAVSPEDWQVDATIWQTLKGS
jgi:hypothetical protein